MTKDKINQFIKESKENEAVKKTFSILEDVAKFLKEDKIFFAFASKQAKNNFVSPAEMFILVYDYLNKTGKYQEYLDKKAKVSKPKAKKESKPVKKEDVDIFSLDL